MRLYNRKLFLVKKVGTMLVPLVRRRLQRNKAYHYYIPRYPKDSNVPIGIRFLAIQLKARKPENARVRIKSNRFFMFIALNCEGGRCDG